MFPVVSMHYLAIGEHMAEHEHLSMSVAIVLKSPTARGGANLKCPRLCTSLCIFSSSHRDKGQKH